MLDPLRRELPPMLRLAGPVVLAELGWMFMGTVDTIMLGRYSREALAGGSTGNAIFHTIALFSLGLMLGLDTLVAQAFGAGKVQDCHHSLRQGVFVAFGLTPVVMTIGALSPVFMTWVGVAEEVRVQAASYIYAVNWSALPLLLYAAFRRYLQGMNLVKPVMFALVTANVVNIAVNWTLIFGKLGAPELGTQGAAWATVLSRWYMAGVLILYTGWREWKTSTGPFRARWALDSARIREILSLGSPAAAQIGLEVAAFSLATVLASTLSTVAVAAHQVALNTAGLSFMVPLGISSAGAVRVGQAAGARDPDRVRRSGWTALALGGAFMLAAGAAFVLVPRAILGVYTNDATVIAIGVILLYVAAIFQLFDGLQVVATGVLRGLGDTRTPMLANLAGHWFLGLPAGYLLCFHTGLGVVGLWVGLSVGLIAVAIALVIAWRRRSHSYVPL